MATTAYDRYLRILLFLFGIYSAGFLTLLKVASQMGFGERNTEINTMDSIYASILVGIAIVFLLNWLLVVFSGILELTSALDARKQKNKIIVTFLRQQVLNSPLNLVLNNLAIVLLIYLVLVTFLVWWLALVLIILMSAAFYITFWYVKNNRSNILESIKKMNDEELKITKGLIVGIIVISIWLIIASWTLYGAIMHYSVDFNVIYDKDVYFSDDDVFLQVYPKGISKPEILNITYSNEKHSVEYVFHDKFRKSPAYLKIPSDLLTEKPYNSFITINYRLPFIFTGKTSSKSEFVPVFNASIKPSKINNWPVILANNSCVIPLS